MVLQNKYNELVTAATDSGVANLQVREQEGILYIDGEAPTGAVKDMLWSVYDRIDPNFLSGDLVMNINVIATAPVTKAKVTTEHSNLNIRKGPGTDQPIVGKAAHHEIVTVGVMKDVAYKTVDNPEEVVDNRQILHPHITCLEN
ncbi:MAG: SH3 domain-containing protein [Chitinophagaceae bacterium]|nr:SH3 domain-containing protein [Chitinophagaceae bacterium]